MVEDAIRVEYDFVQPETGAMKVTVHLSPTLDTRNAGGIRLGISVDNGPVKILTSTLQPTAGGVGNSDQADWVAAVTDNNHALSASFDQLAVGEHTLKLWRLDDNIVVEKLMLSKPE